MTGFAYSIDGGQAEAIPIRAAVEAKARLVWVHLETNDAVAQRLQAIRIEAHYAELVERRGPVPDDVRREVAAEWDDPIPGR